MAFTGQYTSAFWGLLLIIATLIVQSFIAAAVKAQRPGNVPGKLDPALSHESFVFRAQRTFMNSLESLPAMFATSFLAFFVGANPTWTAIFIWTFATGRLLHMLLYYGIATERNPSPRSWFFLLALAANIGLLGLCFLALL